eukprot:TRINITY_DN441_c0_g5_i1.p1 TRINITY_DN441_c0_g5~~TRINITY_DN441_c0_g5_i1.p1  ORF type:complete len:426 (-),score=80.67 TRINITY_DN441_c0_g5_i1:69-1226(-)
MVGVRRSKELLLLLFIIVIVFILGVYGGETDKKNNNNNNNQLITKKKYAYATIHYEGTSMDSAYVLAIRVMIQSLKLSRTEADIIVLASETVTQATRETFMDDGAQIISVNNVQNPYKLQQPRFINTLNKLHLWNLTQYERIIYMDADTIAVWKNGNLDELFECGSFCVVYQNPCFFHTGLLVLQPNTTLYTQMINAITSTRSYDGADQGFLTAFFPYDLMASAPLFLPFSNLSSYYSSSLSSSLSSSSSSPHSNNKQHSIAQHYRLPPGYNLNAFWYYEKGTYSLYQCSSRFANTSFNQLSEIPGLSITYPVPPFLKPWYWYTYLIFDTNWSFWSLTRSSIPSSSSLHLLLLSSLFHLSFISISLYYVLYSPSPPPPSLPSPIS